MPSNLSAGAAALRVFELELLVCKTLKLVRTEVSESALTVHLVGHNVGKPGSCGEISSLSF